MVLSPSIEAMTTNVFEVCDMERYHIEWYSYEARDKTSNTYLLEQIHKEWKVQGRLCCLSKDEEGNQEEVLWRFQIIVNEAYKKSSIIIPFDHPPPSCIDLTLLDHGTLNKSSTANNETIIARLAQLFKEFMIATVAMDNTNNTYAQSSFAIIISNLKVILHHDQLCILLGNSKEENPKTITLHDIQKEFMTRKFEEAVRSKSTDIHRFARKRPHPSSSSSVNENTDAAVRSTTSIAKFSIDLETNETQENNEKKKNPVLSELQKQVENQMKSLNEGGTVVVQEQMVVAPQYKSTFANHTSQLLKQIDDDQQERWYDVKRMSSSCCCSYSATLKRNATGIPNYFDIKTLQEFDQSRFKNSTTSLPTGSSRTNESGFSKDEIRFLLSQALVPWRTTTTVNYRTTTNDSSSAKNYHRLLPVLSTLKQGLLEPRSNIMISSAVSSLSASFKSLSEVFQNSTHTTTTSNNSKVLVRSSAAAASRLSSDSTGDDDDDGIMALDLFTVWESWQEIHCQPVYSRKKDIDVAVLTSCNNNDDIFNDGVSLLLNLVSMYNDCDLGLASPVFSSLESSVVFCKNTTFHEGLKKILLQWKTSSRSSSSSSSLVIYIVNPFPRKSRLELLSSLYSLVVEDNCSVVFEVLESTSGGLYNSARVLKEVVFSVFTKVKVKQSAIVVAKPSTSTVAPLTPQRRSSRSTAQAAAMAQANAASNTPKQSSTKYEDTSVYEPLVILDSKSAAASLHGAWCVYNNTFIIYVWADSVGHLFSVGCASILEEDGMTEFCNAGLAAAESNFDSHPVIIVSKLFTSDNSIITTEEHEVLERVLKSIVICTVAVKHGWIQILNEEEEEEDDDRIIVYQDDNNKSGYILNGNRSALEVSIVKCSNTCVKMKDLLQKFDEMSLLTLHPVTLKKYHLPSLPYHMAPLIQFSNSSKANSFLDHLH